MEINIYNTKHVDWLDTLYIKENDEEFHMITLTIIWSDWLGKDHEQKINLYSNKDIHLDINYTDFEDSNPS